MTAYAAASWHTILTQWIIRYSPFRSSVLFRAAAPPQPRHASLIGGVRPAAQYFSSTHCSASFSWSLS